MLLQILQEKRKEVNNIKYFCLFISQVVPPCIHTFVLSEISLKAQLVTGRSLCARIMCHMISL